MLTFAWLGDHFKYHAEYDGAGIRAFYPWMNGQKKVKYGGFSILPFSLPHGDMQSYGFYITHDEIGKMLFLTDFEYCPYSFDKYNVNHILIECNYDLEYIDVDAPNFKHKVTGHCELQTCKEFVRHNQSKHLRNVVLIHGSDMTLDSKQAVKEIESVVDPDVNVVYATKGLQMMLKRDVF